MGAAFLNPVRGSVKGFRVLVDLRFRVPIQGLFVGCLRTLLWGLEQEPTNNQDRGSWGLGLGTPVLIEQPLNPKKPKPEKP